MLERRFSGVLVIAMVITVFYGVLKLRRMQAKYDGRCPPKAPKTSRVASRRKHAPMSLEVTGIASEKPSRDQSILNA